MNCPSQLYPKCWYGCPDKDVCEDFHSGDDPMNLEEEEKFNQILSKLGGKQCY